MRTAFFAVLTGSSSEAFATRKAPGASPLDRQRDLPAARAEEPIVGARTETTSAQLVDARYRASIYECSIRRLTDPMEQHLAKSGTRFPTRNSKPIDGAANRICDVEQFSA